MRFSIHQLEIENFRSIQKKVTLNIRPGLFSIEGINNDEENSHNGAGKSSILSALYWCLTGNALTNEVLADDVVNVKSGKNCRVSLYIDSDQGSIKITRTRKDSEFGNNLFLEVNEQDLTCHKVMDTQERIVQLLKIPFELLHSTIIMTHDIKSAFSELTPQQRVQALESIRDYSVWDKVREEANKDIKQYNKEIQELNLKSSSIEGSQATYTKMLETAENEVKTLRESFDVDKVSKEIESLNNQNTDLNRQINEESVLLEGLNKKLEEVNVNDSLRSRLNEIVENANNIKLTLQSTEYERKGKVNDIELIDAWFKNDRCPTCNHLLERTEKEISEKSDHREKLKQDLDVISKKIIDINNQLTAKRQEWSQVNSQLQVGEQARKEIQLKLTESNKKINVLKNMLLTNIERLGQLNSMRDSCSFQVDKKLVEMECQRLELGKLAQERAEIQEQIKSLGDKRNLSDYFYKLLGSKGELRPYLLNNDIKYLNHCMQKYIHVFFKNTEAELSLNGANIDIIINSNGISKKVTSLSGGEKKRLNIAIQLGLYDLIKATSQIEFNILFLDEIESELDQVGVNQLIEIIEDKNEDAESVYWITNHPTVKENIQNKIICTKSLGVTTIEER